MSTWSLPQSIHLIRYLIVWRVNHSLIRLPAWLPLELSYVLGKMISTRLPTNQVRPWRQAAEPWEESNFFELERQRKSKYDKLEVPHTTWPIESALFAYPNKRTYGYGELVMWELKLMGNSADHNLFLELILPAMEEACMTTDSRWRRSNKLWGRFDIPSIYVARGMEWEPLIVDGRLDLEMNVTPTQWADGLPFDMPPSRRFHRLKWITSFDLTPPDNVALKNQHTSFITEPSLSDIIVALIARLDHIISNISNKSTSYSRGWDLLEEEEKHKVQEALRQVRPVFNRNQTLRKVPHFWPGRWIGSQRFSTIPEALIPYLNLASILHIGQHTHFGCGTFTLS